MGVIAWLLPLWEGGQDLQEKKKRTRQETACERKWTDRQHITLCLLSQSRLILYPLWAKPKQE